MGGLSNHRKRICCTNRNAGLVIFILDNIQIFDQIVSNRFFFFAKIFIKYRSNDLYKMINVVYYSYDRNILLE